MSAASTYNKVAGSFPRFNICGENRHLCQARKHYVQA